jgi:hypothetical protein
MTQVFFSSSFKRAFKKRIAGQKDLEAKFWQRVEIFASTRLTRVCGRTNFLES